MKTNNPKRTTIIMLMTALLVVINGIGFLAYRAVKSSSSASDVAATQVATPAAGQNVAGEPSAEDAEKKAQEAQANELRKSALQDILNDKYDDAATKITQALTLTSNQRDLPELLAMVKEKQRSSRDEVAANTAEPTRRTVRKAEPEPEPESEKIEKTERIRAAAAPAARPKRKVQRRTASRRPVRRAKRVAEPEEADEEVEEAEPEPVLPETGSIVVLSAPKVAFAIDGKVQGVTPREIEATPGVHTISFRYGTQTLVRRRVTVTAGKKSSVDVDLTEKIRELEVAARTIEAPAKAEPTVAAKPAETTVVRKRTQKPKQVGRVLVMSPVVSGVVYVNGKRYGAPPVLAKNVAVGKAKVQIRSGSRVLRAKTVKVKEGTKAVRVQFR